MSATSVLWCEWHVRGFTLLRTIRCTQPKIEGLRRHLLTSTAADRAAVVILPGEGLCARAAIATTTHLGYGFGAVVASYKEYANPAVHWSWGNRQKTGRKAFSQKLSKRIIDKNTSKQTYDLTKKLVGLD